MTADRPALEAAQHIAANRQTYGSYIVSVANALLSAAKEEDRMREALRSIQLDATDIQSPAEQLLMNIAATARAALLPAGEKP